MVKVSDADFQQVANLAPYALAATDASFCTGGLRLQYVNGAMEELLGYPVDQLVGASLAACCCPVLQEDGAQELLRLSEPLKRGERVFWKAYLRRADKTPVHIAWQIEPVFKAGGLDSLLFYQTNYRSAQDRTENSSDAQFRGVVEFSPDCIAIHRDGRIIYANPAAAVFLRASDVAELVGEPVMRFIDDADRDKALERLRQVYQSQRKQPGLELTFRCADGSLRYGEIHSGPIHFDHGFAVQSVVRDVSDRRQAEDQARRYQHRLEMLSRSLIRAEESLRAQVSRDLHDEIGQELAALRLDLGQSTVETRAISQRIEQIGRRLRDIATGLRPPVLDDFGLADALEWYLNQQARRAGLEMHYEFEIEPESLSADIQTTCFRIVQEAVNNAVKHADASSVRVRLWKEADTLHGSVDDNGCGFLVENALVGASRGLSLGVTTMRERAQLLGGDLRIESSPGEGTAVQFSLPSKELS